MSTNNQNISIFHRYSKFSRLIRIVSWCLRFIYNSSHKEGKKTGPFQPEESTYATGFIIPAVQADLWSREIVELKATGTVSSKSNIFRLSPYLDDIDIIRVGGRLKNAEYLDCSQRNPMLLPPKS